MPPGEKSRQLGAHWRGMSAEERAPFLEDARRLMLTYKEDMAEFLAAGGVQKGPKTPVRQGTGQGADDDGLGPEDGSPATPLRRRRSYQEIFGVPGYAEFREWCAGTLEEHALDPRACAPGIYTCINTSVCVSE